MAFTGRGQGGDMTLTCAFAQDQPRAKRAGAAARAASGLMTKEALRDPDAPSV